jgi:hypothetical protein
MDRRNFLSLAALSLAGKAAERVFPFRVYSIPKKIFIPKDMQILGGEIPTIFGGVSEAAYTYPIGPSVELSRFQSLPVVSTILGPDGSPKGYVKIESVNGKKLTCSSGVVHCKPGDLIVLEDKLYPSEYRKTDPRTGTFLNLARS